jgi:hypothetical protein
MTSTAEDLIEFIRSFREPIKASEAATELHHLGNLGADWPRASYEHWCRELLRLVTEDKLQMSKDGYLSVPIVTDDRPKQQELF